MSNVGVRVLKIQKSGLWTFPTKMKKAIASGNMTSIGGHMIKKGVLDFLEDVRLIGSIFTFDICCYHHGM